MSEMYRRRSKQSCKTDEHSGSGLVETTETRTFSKQDDQTRERRKEVRRDETRIH